MSIKYYVIINDLMEFEKVWVWYVYVMYDDVIKRIVSCLCWDDWINLQIV